ncbi:hypothetical protein [Cupriavidus sp. 8B]
MRQHDVGNLVRLDGVRLELMQEVPAHAERAHVDEDRAAIATQQRYRATAKTAVANGTAGKALDQYVYLMPNQGQGGCPGHTSRFHPIR